MESKKRLPNLCSWCKWGYPERDDCVEPANENREYNLCECIDFQIDPTVTQVDLAWWPIAWAASEGDRLSIKLSIKNNKND